MALIGLSSKNEQSIFDLIVGHDEVISALITGQEARLTNGYPNLVLVIEEPHVGECAPLRIDTPIDEKISAHQACLVAASRRGTDAVFGLDLPYALDHVRNVLSFAKLTLFSLILGFNDYHLLDYYQIIAEFIVMVVFWTFVHCDTTKHIMRIHQGTSFVLELVVFFVRLMT